MELDKYPYFKSLLVSDQKGSYNRPYDGKRIQRLEDALSSWVQAQEVGSIENARFQESKETISRAVEHAWKGIHRDTEWIYSLPRQYQEALDGPYPNLSTIKGRAKRVQATPDSPDRDQVLALLNEITPLAEAYTFLKANAKKKVPRSPEEIEAEKYRLPPTNSKAVKRVRQILEQAIDRTYQGMVQRQQQQNRSLIERYLAAQEKAFSEGEKQYYPSTFLSVKDTRGRSRVSDENALAFLVRVLVKNKPEGTFDQISFIAGPETYEASDKIAIRDVKEIRDHFLYKNTMKLTPVLEAKGDELFADVKEVGQLDMARLEGRFEVSFKDGSSFRLNNAVVYVVNQFNTHFCRFPTTFHNVVLPNGQPMGNPSQERMIEVFAKATTQPPKKLAGP